MDASAAAAAGCTRRQFPFSPAGLPAPFLSPPPQCGLAVKSLLDTVDGWGEDNDLPVADDNSLFFQDTTARPSHTTRSGQNSGAQVGYAGGYAVAGLVTTLAGVLPDWQAALVDTCPRLLTQRLAASDTHHACARCPPGCASGCVDGRRLQLCGRLQVDANQGPL